MNDAVTSPVQIVQLGAQDAERLRAARLAALADAPEAFCSTHAAEVDRPAERWQELVADPARAWFVVDLDGQDGGLVCVHAEETGDAHLTSMWVAPTARGRGVGRLLIEQAMEWARGRGLHRMVLWVVDANEVARMLYAGLGFEPTGETMLMRDDVPESQYARQL